MRRTLRVKLRPDVVFSRRNEDECIMQREALREAISRPGNRALYSSLADVRT
jgi:hypothetical protein